MTTQDTKNMPKSDFMQELDEQFGPQIERAVSRYLPRDRAREVRKETVGNICDIILGDDKKEVSQTVSKGFSHWNGKEWVVRK